MVERTQAFKYSFLTEATSGSTSFLLLYLGAALIDFLPLHIDGNRNSENARGWLGFMSELVSDDASFFVIKHG